MLKDTMSSCSLGVTWMVASQVISAQVAERRVKSMTPISVNFTFDTVSEQCFIITITVKVV